MFSFDFRSKRELEGQLSRNPELHIPKIFVQNVVLEETVCYRPTFAESKIFRLTLRQCDRNTIKCSTDTERTGLLARKQLPYWEGNSNGVGIAISGID